MSRTHRCIDCPQSSEHWTDEICGACGRCPLHCIEIIASFDVNAKIGDPVNGRPHPDAGKTRRLLFVPMPEDPDRAFIPFQPGIDSEPGGIQPSEFLAIQSRALAARSGEAVVQGDDSGDSSDSVRGVGQRGAKSASPGRRNSGGHSK